MELFKEIFNFLHTKYRYFKYSQKYKNNKIILCYENGKEKEVTPITYIKGFNIVFKGNNNVVKIAYPQRKPRIKIYFFGNDNFVTIGKNCNGKLEFRFNGDGKFGQVGSNINSCDFIARLENSNLIIGNNCLFSNTIKLWTDGHSVIDNTTKELLNSQTATIKIGDHVWIGENVTMLKKTNIPSNCIIGHSSVVTKGFTEENCVYAGNPAKLVKQGINWNCLAPKDYNKETADLSF